MFKKLRLFGLFPVLAMCACTASGGGYGGGYGSASLGYDGYGQPYYGQQPSYGYPSPQSYGYLPPQYGGVPQQSYQVGLDPGAASLLGGAIGAFGGALAGAALNNRGHHHWHHWGRRSYYRGGGYGYGGYGYGYGY